MNSTLSSNVLTTCVVPGVAVQRFLLTLWRFWIRSASFLGIATLLGLQAHVVQAQTPPAGYYLACAEGAQCVIGPFSKDVAFGVGTQLNKRVGMSGTFTCNQDTFGGDPARKQAKYCFISIQESRRQAVAIGGTYFNVKPTNQRGFPGMPGPRRVWYGVDGSFVEKEVVGNVFCGDQTFGDPARGRYKGCFIFQPW
ncbi:hypothetical protein ACHEXK_10970 [Limnohabitans sp. DCL3]|uniref:hypothetical protein n=1 Tax=Limnohabitans sp. DCL3 TaxID=3374103 RepID=UPI003A85013D